MAKLDKNTLIKLISKARKESDGLSDKELLTKALTEAYNFGYEMPGVDKLSEWFEKAAKKQQRAKESEWSKEHDKYMKDSGIGKDRSKWAEYVENVVPFEQTLSEPAGRAINISSDRSQKNAAKTRPSLKTGKYSTAFYKLMNPEGKRLSWGLQMGERDLDGPGAWVYNAFNAKVPKVVTKSMPEHIATKLRTLRDEYSEIPRKANFYEWLQDPNDKNFNPKTGWRSDVDMEVQRALNAAYDPNAHGLKQDASEDNWQITGKPIGFIPLKDGINDEAIRQYLLSMRPDENNHVFPKHTPEEYELMNKLKSIENLSLQTAAKRLKTKPEKVAKMLLQNGLYGVDKTAGVKRLKFVNDPIDLQALAALDTAPDASKSQTAEEAGYKPTKTILGKGGLEIRKTVNPETGVTTEKQKGMDKTQYRDKDGNAVVKTNEWKLNPKTGKKERVTITGEEAVAQQNKKSHELDAKALAAQEERKLMSQSKWDELNDEKGKEAAEKYLEGRGIESSKSKRRNKKDFGKAMRAVGNTDVSSIAALLSDLGAKG